MGRNSPSFNASCTGGVFAPYPRIFCPALASPAGGVVTTHNGDHHAPPKRPRARIALVGSRMPPHHGLRDYDRSNREPRHSRHHEQLIDRESWIEHWFAPATEVTFNPAFARLSVGTVKTSSVRSPADPRGRHRRPPGPAFRVPLCDNMSGSPNPTIERSFTRAPEPRWGQVHGIAGSQANRLTGWPRLALNERCEW